MTDSKSPDWLGSNQGAFGDLALATDAFQGSMATDHHALVETWMFEAIVPERELSACFYIAARPNLRISSAGCWMWRGFNRSHMHAEHLNLHTFAPYPIVGDGALSVPVAGIKLEVLSPLEAVRVTYLSPESDNRAELIFKAMTPPVMRADNKHFDQPMWASGEIIVNGEKIRVDGAGWRDRSWGKPRPENPSNSPPLSFAYGSFNQGEIVFSFTGFDDPKTAVWADSYDVPQPLLDAWIIKEGRLEKLVTMNKRTICDPSDLDRAITTLLKFYDAGGTKYELRGTAKNGIGVHFWPNIQIWQRQTKWEFAGLTGYGEIQDIVWPDYCRKFERRLS